MCRELMRASTSDGAKLDLWKRWLGLVDPGDQTKGKQSADLDLGDDNGSMEWSPVPPLEHVTAVLRAKVSNFHFEGETLY